jgi:hypothetical protein
VGERTGLQQLGGAPTAGRHSERAQGHSCDHDRARNTPMHTTRQPRTTREKRVQSTAETRAARSKDRRGRPQARANRDTPRSDHTPDNIAPTPPHPPTPTKAQPGSRNPTQSPKRANSGKRTQHPTVNIGLVATVRKIPASSVFLTLRDFRVQERGHGCDRRARHTVLRRPILRRGHA